MSEIVGKALSEGKTGALTQFGAKFKELGNIAENTNSFLKETAGFVGAATDAMGDYAAQEKMAENNAEKLQETVGEKLAPVWVKVKTAVLGAADALLDFYKAVLSGDNIDIMA